MPVTPKVLIPGTVVPTAAGATPTYAATNVTTIVDKFTATNYSAAVVTVSVYLQQATTGGTNTELVVKNKSLSPGQTYTFPEIVGHIISKGGSIQILASAATSVSVRASGREIN